MTLQAIIKKRETHSVSFVDGRPSKELTTALMKAGFTYDGKSQQWYCSTQSGRVVDEAEVTRIFMGE